MSQTLIKADLRAFIPLNEKITFVPLANLMLASGTDGSTYSTGPINSDSYDLPSRFQLLLGAGINYTVGDFLFAGGPSFLVTSDKDKETNPEIENTSTSIIWNLGAEWSCNSWLTARLGYKTLGGSATIETALGGYKNSVTQSIYGADDGFMFGLGFKLAGLSLDATVNTDVLRQGLNNIGGGGATLGFLSASYAF